MATIAGFLGYINYRNPFLGKSLDYLVGAGRNRNNILQITMPEGAVVTDYVSTARAEIEKYARVFFGQKVAVEIRTEPGLSPDLRLFPVENSKLWNQITFFLMFGGVDCDDLPGAGVGGLVIGKKEYKVLQKQFTPALERTELEKMIIELEGEFFQDADLAAMVDRVVPRAQERRGIIHLVTLCTRKQDFLELDYTLARIKESGTPGHEGPLQVRSLLGRLHAVFPGQYCTGLSVVHRLAS
ncbi:MAG: hypothetical protein J7J71_03885 [Deltaproteobacteria bacterium]|nr:hypothetical protein [Candidatus Tharpella sp.]